MRTLRILAVILIVAALLTALAVAERRPNGRPGPEADEFARRMMAAVGDDGWQRTGAVRWTYRGRNHHLWDRDRSLARVRWDNVEVLLDLGTRGGLASRRGRRLEGPRADKLVHKAFAHWTNDSFWLNPISKVFDPGTVRSLVDLEDGGEGLLVEYTSGGLTPGDAYLWLLGEDGLPNRWKMWTSNLPKGGVGASWEAWVTLSTGVRIATRHRLALGKVEIGEVAGAASLAELEPGPDPFAPLLAPAR